MCVTCFLCKNNLKLTSHLFWQRDHCSMLCEGRDLLQEVLTTGREHGTVGSKTLTVYQHRHITQHVPATLLIQAVQHLGGMHCRLECKHRRSWRKPSHHRHLCVHKKHKHTQVNHSHTTEIKFKQRCCIT